MKKIFLAVLAIVGVCNTTSAQYTPQKNDISVEVGFNPFKGGNGVFTLDKELGDQYQFKVRWMFTDKDALRFKLGLGIDNRTTKDETTDGIKYNIGDTYPTGVTNFPNDPHFTTSSLEQTDNYTSISFSVGYERHFPVSQRIDLYAGGEVGYRIESCSGKITENYRNEWYNGADNKLESYIDGSSTKEYTNKTPSGSYAKNSLTVAAFSGFDFYVYKGLYVGAELGIKFANGKDSKQAYYTESISESGMASISNKTGYSYISNYSSETGLMTGKEVMGDTTTDINEIYGKYLSESSATRLKFYVEPNFRLGIKF